MPVLAMVRPLFGTLFYFGLILIVLNLSPISCTQNDGEITVGQSLYANNNGTSSLLSPSGDFAFGFQQVDSNNNLFLLSIWYAKIPDTIVWYANGGNLVPQGSKVTVTVTEGLTLSDTSGTPLWNTTELSGAGAVSHGFMNDSGNFVLVASNNGDPLWQTFDYPTDTLLPTQVLEQGTGVYSRMTETNFTNGRFELLLQLDGNLVISTRDLTTSFRYHPYYASMTWDHGDPGNTAAGESLVYSESGDMYVLLKNGSRFDLIPPNKLVSDKNFYQKVTLNFDGVLTWNYHPRTFTSNDNVDWSTVKSIPDDICTAIPTGNGDSGACGYNSICRIDDNQRPVCECPPGYSLIDPSYPHGSCQPDFGLNFCQGGVQGAYKDGYKLVRLQNTAWNMEYYAELNPCSEEECQTSCLNDCFCAAAVASPDNSCYKQKFPFSYGVQDTALGKTTWLKIRNGNQSYEVMNPVLVPVKSKNKLNGGIIALLCGSAGFNFILLTAICLIFLFMYKKKTSKMYAGSPNRILQEYGSVHCFSYKELENATNGFKEEIGRGAFGVVYRGRFGAGDPSTIVAVKKLDRMSKNADKEFTAEVNVIGQTHHKNLVRLVGYCKEEDQRLLVYEYMSNGTVADFLFGDLKPTWMSRVKIAQGVAKGLLYLHEECSTQIIHCDIKPQNILLDDCHNVRISDFGLAKLLVLNQNQTTTAVRGTKGYVAPEWFRNKPVTVKVDVYSFGVLLLEIICCRRCICMDIIGQEAAILTDWAFDCYQSGQLESLVDDRDALSDRPRLERFVKVALWCIQEEPSVRPTMKQVMQMLEGVAEVPNPPCPTSFSVTVSA